MRAAVDSYLSELRRAGRREHTLRGYRTDLAILIECAAPAGGVLDGTAVVAYLARSSGEAPATRARRRSALRGFLRWAGRINLLAEAEKHAPDAVPPVRARGGHGRVPVRSDVEAVLAQIPRQADRDQLLFGLLARLGLRPGEALALRIEDFDESGQCLHVPGWGGTRRRVLVDHRQILLRLGNYRRTTGKAAGALFTAPGRETPLRYQSALARWDRYCVAAGVVVHLADLRRLHAEELLAGGVPEAVVRDRLGQRTGPLTAPVTPPSADSSDEAIRAWHAGSAGRVDPTGTEHDRGGRTG